VSEGRQAARPVIKAHPAWKVTSNFCAAKIHQNFITDYLIVVLSLLKAGVQVNLAQIVTATEFITTRAQLRNLLFVHPRK
jgi:hypothetical protein